MEDILWIEKNIGSPNYLQILKVWIVLLTYTLLKEKVEQNTDVVIFSLYYQLLLTSVPR